MKKGLLLIMICLIITVVLQAKAVHLNKYGHLDFEKIKKDIDYFMENGIYKIEYENHIFTGNSIYDIENGYLTLTTIQENVPTELRIYNEMGKQKFYQEFTKVINLKISQNNKYIAFFDGKNLLVVDSENLKKKKYPESIKFMIDNKGDPIYFKANNSSLNYNKHSQAMDEFPTSVLLHRQKPLIFSGSSIYTFENENLKMLNNFQNKILETKIINNKLYCAVREKTEQAYLFKLYRTDNLSDFTKIDEKSYSLLENKTPDPIHAPLDYSQPNKTYPIGNSYGEIQQYGSSPYLHPGVDFLGDDYEAVYAVHDGYVKAVLTTGGSAYWRVAISNEDTASESEGYLYAHLNYNSITVSVGDYVEAGQQIGTLYPWGYYDFTHIHFARVECSGATWNGNWWSIDDVLYDVTNMVDFSGPVFEDAYNNNLFAFRDNSGNYQDPDNLQGEIDIIAKCHDIANSSWRIDVHDLSFKLHSVNEPDNTIYEKFSYSYDFPLDTYINGSWEDVILYTIYSRDATCYSIGNYDEREYYHIITNSDGDSTITEDDQYENFDTEDFADGDYILEVIAHDASGNESSASMNISFNNLDVEPEPNNQTKINLSNYPNPFAESTTISFNLNKDHTENLKIFIYNTKGEKIKTLPVSPSHSQEVSIVWDAQDIKSGIYFYKVVSGDNSATEKMILLK